jgi:hypothetical protein
MKHKAHHAPLRVYLPRAPQKVHAMQERAWEAKQKPQPAAPALVVQRNRGSNERATTR